MEAIHSPTTSISLHFVDGEAVLFDSRRQQLTLMNAPAAYVLGCFDRRMPRDTIVDRLKDKFGLPQKAAENQVDDVWRGIVGRDVIAFSTAALETSHLFQPGRRRGAPLPKPTSVQAYQLLDSRFVLRFGSTKIAQAVDSVLQQFKTARSGSSAATFDVVAVRGGYAILEDARPLERCRALQGIAAMVTGCLMFRALGASRDFCAIQGAAAQTPTGNCVVLAGPCGSGKSTLAAGLAASGFTLLSDDTTILPDIEKGVRPLPCSIAVKPGSWNVLSSLYPELKDAPVHRRADDGEVRYLQPQRHACSATRAPIGWIVFPYFDAKAETALRPVSKSEALRRLTVCLLPLRGALSNQDVDRLVAWVNETPCLELRHSSLEEGLACLRELCG
jgi:energy-coupling factor transporter ATP-binding protein EcfA2